MHDFGSDEHAVSPVIGTILILFIIITSMAGILAWGVPAIQGLQEHAEFQSMLTQAHQANAELLKFRDPNVANTVTISMNQGELRVDPGSRWVITTFLDAAYTGIYFTGWQNSGAIVAKTVPVASKMYVDVATSSFTAVAGSPFTCNAAADCTGAAVALTMSAAANPVVRIQIKDTATSTLKVESWIFNAGRITYKLSSDSTFNRLHVEMGAVFTQQGNAVFVDRKPTVKEPDFVISPADTSYLVRGFQVQQNTNTVVTGKGRHSLHVSLEDNFGATRGRPFLSSAVAVRLQVDDGGAAGVKGALEEGFCTYFDTLLPAPNDFYTPRVACSSGEADVLFDPPDDASHNLGKFSYEFSQAVVRANVKFV